MEWTVKRFESFRAMVEWHVENQDRYLIHVISYKPSFILHYREYKKG
jgi:hypothetical protein